MKAATIGIALAIGCAQGAFGTERSAPAQFDGVIAKHSAATGVPEALIRRVIVRESRYNPRAFSRGHYGMMQIKPATARSMGYRGAPTGLLDADVNLTYAVRYLAGAYRVAGGNHDRAVRLYASGYYYDAKRRGMLAAIGMGRDGKLTAPAMAQTAPTAAAPVQAPQETSPSARAQVAFANFDAAPQVRSGPPAPRDAVAYAAAAPSPFVPIPPAREAASATRQVMAAATIPTPPARPVDDKARAAPLLATPTPPVRDVATTGSVASQPRPATQPAIVAAAAPLSAAGPRIPLPAARDDVVAAKLAAAKLAAAKPAAGGRRVIAVDAAPALAGAGPLPQTVSRTAPTPLPPRR